MTQKTALFLFTVAALLCQASLASGAFEAGKNVAIKHWGLVLLTIGDSPVGCTHTQPV